jgi:Flp pilus assembly protein CpaB
VAAGLAVTAAAVLAAGPRETEQARGHPVADPVRERRAVQLVTAPVRIADAATVRLLRPGDRVDVIAAEQTATGGDARVVARGARVTKVPETLDSPGGTAEGGALVVLSVPRSTAARLAGASTTARLAVTLC